MNNPGDPYLMTVSWHKIAWMVNRKKLLKIREVCLKLKTHFAADGFLTCIEQHEIITEIPRVARRALVSFLQKLKKNGKERECHRLLFKCGISTAITSSELNEVNSR